MINIGILTSSRADFGIYEPLLKAIINEKRINPQLIVFGTHLSKSYGYSIANIEKIPIPIIARFDTAPAEDSPSAIISAMALTMQSMVKVWQQNTFDLIIALGDRYEMFAAVSSTLPFNLKVAHIHGGETTLGAIDNAMRHSITHMAKLHFTAADQYYKRVKELTGDDKGVYNTGALSIDSLSSMKFMSREEIYTEYDIRFDVPTILVTIHPETVGYSNNEKHTGEVVKALGMFEDIQQIITMPNADTSGLAIRKRLNEYAQGKKNVRLVENFGSHGYLSIMKHADVVLGNSSSGFTEASWFPKWVINIGDRQKGRIRTSNIIDVAFNEPEINSAINTALNLKVPVVEPIYGDGTAAQKILKNILNEFSTD